MRWALLSTLVASGLALWWPNAATQVAQPRETVPAQTAPASDELPLKLQQRGPATNLPAKLQVANLDKAEFDPFVGLQPPPPPPPEPPPPPAPVQVAPPPPPSPPPLTYRYLGQMTDPSGKQIVYLGRADKDVAVAAGTALDEGYVVESIDAEGVHLRYPALEARAVIRFPVNVGSLP